MEIEDKVVASARKQVATVQRLAYCGAHVFKKIFETAKCF